MQQSCIFYVTPVKKDMMEGLHTDQNLKITIEYFYQPYNKTYEQKISFTKIRGVKMQKKNKKSK